MNRLLTKSEHEWNRGEITCLPFSGGWGGGNGLSGEAPAERGTFLMLQVYERVGLLLVLFLAEGFFSGCSGFPLSSKTNFSQFQFFPEGSDTFTRVLNNFQVLRGKPNYKYDRKYFLLKSK